MGCATQNPSCTVAGIHGGYRLRLDPPYDDTAAEPRPEAPQTVIPANAGIQPLFSAVPPIIAADSWPALGVAQCAALIAPYELEAPGLIEGDQAFVAARANGSQARRMNFRHPA
ncbi:hypothetical protein GCM10027359_18970 [Marilutibacter aestuarii]